MRVLVRVNVREMEAAALKKADLCCGFGLDLSGADAAGEEMTEKLAELLRKTAGLRVYE